MENNIGQPLYTQIIGNKKVLFSILGIFILLVLFMVSMIFFFSGRKAEEKTTLLPKEVKQEEKTVSIKRKVLQKMPAVVSLFLKDEKKTYHVRDDIVIIVSADTNSQKILGYDVVFRFDKKLVTYTFEKDLFPTFSYDLRPRGEWIIITGVLPFGKKEGVILGKTNLMEIHFKAVASGVAHFPLSFVLDRINDTNLINEKGEDIITDVKGINVTILP